MIKIKFDLFSFLFFFSLSLSLSLIYKKSVYMTKTGAEYMVHNNRNGGVRFQTPLSGLKAAAQRGLVAMFQALCRKMPGSRLGKQDDQGLSLLHHAAMNNRPQLIALLLVQSMDVNVRRNNILSTGKWHHHHDVYPSGTFFLMGRL